MLNRNTTKGCWCWQTWEYNWWSIWFLPIKKIRIKQEVVIHKFLKKLSIKVLPKERKVLPHWLLMCLCLPSFRLGRMFAISRGFLDRGWNTMEAIGLPGGFCRISFSGIVAAPESSSSISFPLLSIVVFIVKDLFSFYSNTF